MILPDFLNLELFVFLVTFGAGIFGVIKFRNSFLIGLQIIADTSLKRRFNPKELFGVASIFFLISFLQVMIFFKIGGGFFTELYWLVYPLFTLSLFLWVTFQEWKLRKKVGNGKLPTAIEQLTELSKNEN